MSAEDDCNKPICMDSPYGNLRKNLGDVLQAECPLDRQQLGRNSWSLMHTFAAYYPENPSEQDKQSIKGFFEGFKQLYPCTHCRGHFQKDYEKGNKYLIKDPPNFDDHK